MPEKSIFTQLEWTHVWLAFVTALWGGVVSYIRRVQFGEKFSCASAAMHMTMSGFAGLICWLGCVQYDIPAPLTAICTGLAGHLGAEFIRIVEGRFVTKLGFDGFLKRATDINPNATPSGPNLGRRAEDRVGK